MKSNSLKSYGALAVAGFCLLIGLAANAAKPTRIAVCHVPADTPANTQLIEVGSNGGALADHLSHGDWEATPAICEDDIADNDCDGNVDDPDAENYDCVIQTGNADATCENNECIEPPATCPCNYDAIATTAANWGSQTFKFVTASSCGLDSFTTIPQIVLRADIAAGSCLRLVNPGGTVNVPGLSEEQASACAADIDAYTADLLGNGVSVSNGTTPCPTP